MIPNHWTPKLSELDLKMVAPVPPGGNWKNIPPSVPSKRLEQIRISCSLGKGSRSTYYGRLHPDRPSYTISTYFNRPGNGCFIHYDIKGDQNRVISQREAARLQSFPDSFIFYGSKASINKQIGNAVPPLLSFQLAKAISQTGCFIDLFSGAGGVSLGFHWAGWNQLLANDIEDSFLETYSKNLGGTILEGDICEKKIFQEIIRVSSEKRHLIGNSPLIVLGGPPCQGFSTAGNKRSVSDQRNHLFLQYAKVLKELKPDGFIFENVMGLKNMEGGDFLKQIKQTLEKTGFKIKDWVIRSENHGIPQRRARVFLVGEKNNSLKFERPKDITNFDKKQMSLNNLPNIIGVKEALDDLPPLQPRNNGENLNYLKNSCNSFQSFMRGKPLPTIIMILCNIQVPNSD